MTAENTFSSLNENEELNPITLKFKTKLNYCSRHLPKQQKLPFISKLFNRNINNPHNHDSKTDENILVGNLNGTCLSCLQENSNLAKYSETRERKYNNQLMPLYKYHIIMCLTIFLAIAFVLGILGFIKQVTYLSFYV